jgi:protein SCO1/2
VSVFLVVGHFLVPFLALMSRNVKRRLPLLVAGASWMLFMHYVDLTWLIRPAHSEGAVPLSLMDLTTFVGIGGLFGAALVRRLSPTRSFRRRTRALRVSLLRELLMAKPPISHVEQSEPDAFQIMFIGALGSILVVVSVFVVQGFYERRRHYEFQRKIVAETPRDLTRRASSSSRSSRPAGSTASTGSSPCRSSGRWSCSRPPRTPRRPWEPRERAGPRLILSAAPAVEPPDRTDPVPPVLREVGVTEHPDAKLPLDLPFTDEAGRPVRLSDFLAPRRPLILTLNYYRCPMLCTLELNGLTEGLRGLDWSIGREFDVVTVSIDPKETPALARAKKQSYLEGYRRAGAESGWHFPDRIRGLDRKPEPDARLRGHLRPRDRPVRAPRGDLHGHPGGARVAVPLRGSLRAENAHARPHRSGRRAHRLAWDRFVLYCYHYDSRQGRYALAAMKLMRAGGVATVLIFGAVLSGLWLRERRRTRAEA